MREVDEDHPPGYVAAATPLEEEEMDTKIKIDSADEYFGSYADLDVHRLMLEDKARTEAYMNAIYNGKTYFEGKVVMDIGAGSGILSLFCAKAGAKKVYAVEASNLACLLPEVFVQNKTSDIVEVLHSRVEDVDLGNEKVDVIVSEWMGFYLLHESMLDSVLFARDKFLKPGTGLMFPNTAQIYAAPCSVPELWKNSVTYWQSPIYGFDLSPLGKFSKCKSKPEIFEVNPDHIYSDPQLVWEFDLSTVDRNSFNALRDRRFFTIEQDCDIQGVCIWFSCGFPSEPEKEESMLSTGPWDIATHWKQTVIMCPGIVHQEVGDIIGWNFSIEKDITSKSDRSFQLHLEILDSSEEHPVPCTCGSVKCEIISHYIATQNSIGSVGKD